MARKPAITKADSRRSIAKSPAWSTTATTSSVIHVNNQRTRDGVPTLNTDWWNYGGLTRDVSLIETPEIFVDDYSLQLQRGPDSTLPFGRTSSAHATARRSRCGCRTGSVAERLHRRARARLISFTAKNLQRWSPQTPKLYDIEINAGKDHLKDSIGFRTIEVQGENILLNGKPSSCAACRSTRRRRIARAVPGAKRTPRRCSAGRKNWAATSCGWRTIPTTNA